MNAALCSRRVAATAKTKTPGETRVRGECKRGRMEARKNEKEEEAGRRDNVGKVSSPEETARKILLDFETVIEEARVRIGSRWTATLATIVRKM